jgi:alpha-ketoglutarate-dependent 2,4-dichlorophenoxyacetate dioxygenase
MAGSLKKPMSLTVERIGREFAGEVSGLDCGEPLTREQVATIEAEMDRFAVLVYRGQLLSDEQQLAFTLHFGELEGKQQGRGRTSGHIHFRTDEQVRRLHPGIGDFSNIDSEGRPLPVDSRAYKFKLADQLWHSDSSFMPVPAKYSVLCAHAVPSWGGNTEFADMRAAYDALDARTKAEVEDLVCLHSQVYSREAVGFDDMSDAERAEFRPVRQRLVRVHPVTKRKSLFLSSHAGRIEGWSTADARMFLRDLVEHATQPQFVYSHEWSIGDMVVWDNRVTMHRGRRFDPTQPRDVRQTRLAGDASTIEQLD